MASLSDVKQITREGDVKELKTFSEQDWAEIAEYILDEHRTRKNERELKERHWAEIDRQIAMEPDRGSKRLPDGTLDASKKWLAEMEMPLQAQALEVLTADVRRFLFAEGQPWFHSNGKTDTDLFTLLESKNLFDDKKLELPSRITQDNVNMLLRGFTLSFLNEYDFYTRYDRVMAESLKYGMGVGRLRKHRKSTWIHESMGVRKDSKYSPVFCPVSIKNLYLDAPISSMHTMTELGPGHIAVDYARLENMALAAKKGSSNPEDADGGWMLDNFQGIEPDENGFVTIYEWEGDLVVPREDSRSIVIPGAIVTVIEGCDSKGYNVIRFRFRKEPYSSYLLHPYQYESADEIYPCGPLEKGRPLQIMAADAVNRLMDSAALKNDPPIGYDRSSPVFASDGGPRVYPGAVWNTIDPVEVYDKIGGDQGALNQLFIACVDMYSELLGVLPARIGAQTVSHTTAYAKEKELQRGAVRTVDFAKSVGHGPLTRFLYMNYDMARECMGRDYSFFAKEYGCWLMIPSKKYLPEICNFEWYGDAGPADEKERVRKKLQATQLALQVDQLGVQAGRPAKLDHGSIIEEILREGGYTDVDVMMLEEGQPQLAEQRPGGPMAAKPNRSGPPTRRAGPGDQPIQRQQPNPGAAAVALQQLGLANKT